jgi:hypothetical protein
LLKKAPVELIFWITALTALAVTDPLTPHYSLCIFRLLGWRRCPGCGLGHAIAYLIRGEFVKSWESHPMGLPAFLIILHRIAVLGTPYYLKLKKTLYGFKLPFVLAGNRQY